MTTAFDSWIKMMEVGNHEGLWELLDPDCVFWSPIVHTPQEGRQISHAYLSAAGHVFKDGFHYTRTAIDGDYGVFEFECAMDGIKVNGVDIITLKENLIIEFKVMVRPLKAINMVHQKMLAMLQETKG